MNTRHLFALAVAVCFGTLSQAKAETTMPDDTDGSSPVFVVHTTTRTVQAVNYDVLQGNGLGRFRNDPFKP